MSADVKRKVSNRNGNRNGCWPPKRPVLLDLLAQNKLALVKARKLGDIESAKLLSQEKASLLWCLKRWCPDCGGAKHRLRMTCNMCWIKRKPKTRRKRVTLTTTSLTK
jgi:hypothetical protein